MQVAENRINQGCFVWLQVQRLWGFLDLALKHLEISEYLDDSHLSLPLVTPMCTNPKTRASQSFVHPLEEITLLTSPNPFSSHLLPINPCKRTSPGAGIYFDSFHSPISDSCHLWKQESGFCYPLWWGYMREVEAGASVPRKISGCQGSASHSSLGHKSRERILPSFEQTMLYLSPFSAETLNQTVSSPCPGAQLLIYLRVSPPRSIPGTGRC